MRLLIVTPLSVAVDLDGIVSVRADDSTGSFMILPEHADFLTILSISVVSWHTQDGRNGQIAVRGGTMRVEDGELVRIATRQAVAGASLEELRGAVLTELRQEAEHEAATRTATQRLQMGLLRQLDRYIKAGRGTLFGAGGMPSLSASDLKQDEDEQRF